MQSVLKFVLILACCFTGLAGCAKEDPTEKAEYKDMTEPANMPKMPQKPGAAP